MDSEGRQREGLATSIVRHDGEVEDDDDSSVLGDIRDGATDEGNLVRSRRRQRRQQTTAFRSDWYGMKLAWFVVWGNADVRMRVKSRSAAYWMQEGVRRVRVRWNAQRALADADLMEARR